MIVSLGRWPSVFCCSAPESANSRRPNSAVFFLRRLRTCGLFSRPSSKANGQKRTARREIFWQAKRHVLPVKFSTFSIQIGVSWALKYKLEEIKLLKPKYILLRTLLSIFIHLFVKLCVNIFISNSCTVPGTIVFFSYLIRFTLVREMGVHLELFTKWMTEIILQK